MRSFSRRYDVKCEESGHVFTLSNKTESYNMSMLNSVFLKEMHDPRKMAIIASLSTSSVSTQQINAITAIDDEASQMDLEL